VSQRKSAVRHTFWRMSIYFKEAHNAPPADYWGLVRLRRIEIGSKDI